MGERWEFWQVRSKKHRVFGTEKPWGFGTFSLNILVCCQYPKSGGVFGTWVLSILVCWQVRFKKAYGFWNMTANYRKFLGFWYIEFKYFSVLAVFEK